MSNTILGGKFIIVDRVTEDEVPKKPREVKKKYEFCKSMMYAIQAITGHQTHEIMTNLVAIADEIIESHEIDTTSDDRTFQGWDGRLIKDYIYYPETKVYLGIYLGIKEEYSYGKRYGKESDKYNRVKYSFKSPQSFIRLDDKKFDDIALDGMLMDFSIDFDEPNLIKTKTPAEKRAIVQQKADIARIKREERAALRAAKKANKIP